MRTLVPLSALVAALLAVSGNSMGARGVLRADGLLVVKGAGSSGSKITIVPFGSPAYSLPEGTKRFELALELNGHYLTSFSLEGCPTKEVYFDTSVPGKVGHVEFDFPFMVTLEHLPEEHMFEYEGPVGFVHYAPHMQDFGYDTQYLVRVKDELRQRMDAFQATGIDPGPMSVVAPDPRPNALPGLGRAVPLTHLTSREILALHAGEVPRLMNRITRNTTGPLPLPAGSSIAERASAAEGLFGTGRVQAGTWSGDNTVDDAFRALRSWRREEETIISGRMIVHIVRFTRSDGVQEEFSRVAHEYGAVFYSHGSRSITERAYLELTAVR